MTARLDCETFEQALRSVSSILDVSEARLVRMLGSIDIDSLFETSSPTQTAEHVLYEAINSPPPKWKFSTFWFHLTRFQRPFCVSSGIVALPQAIDRIWDDLSEIALTSSAHEAWTSFRRHVKKNHGGDSYLYASKVADHGHGPYAMLNPIVGRYSGHLSYSDYYRGPEIVKDIFEYFLEYSGFDLTNMYLERSYPGYVKFLVEQGNLDELKCTIYFIYLQISGRPMEHAANAFFDGKGCTVAAAQITSVVDVQLT